MTTVLVPAHRVERWIVNFSVRHGVTRLTVADGALSGSATDGSTFTAKLPFSDEYVGQPDAVAFARAVTTPASWGVLLVRKGGFAIARLAGVHTVESKIGQRHVQGRTKAGGQSQQRFARRRENQARMAYEAAADHAARILGSPSGQVRRLPIITGGDRVAVQEVLADQRLRGITVRGSFLTVADPKRAVLHQAVQDATGARFDVQNVVGSDPYHDET
jgi:hypothetical protein